MSCASEVSQLRKAGRLDDAYSRARDCYASDPSDTYLQRAYGWVLYDLVKREAALFEDKKCPPGKLANRFNEWLDQYRQFGANDRPGMLHSMLLSQVLHGSRVWPSFLAFAKWWGPEYLRPEDIEPYVASNGKALPSLQMRLYYAIGRAILRPDGDPTDDLRTWGEAQLESGLAIAPDDQWLHYYKSKLLLERGNRLQAREWLTPVVRRQRRAAWAWALLARTFPDEAAPLAITCYFRAIQVAVKPDEVANTRIELARMLAAAGRFDEAAVQVRNAHEYRQRQDLRMPPALLQMVTSDWFDERSQRHDLPSEPDVSEEADGILFGGESHRISYRLGVVDNQNPEKALAHVAFAMDEGIVLHYRKFKDITALPLGEVIEVAVDVDRKQPIRWRRADDSEIVGFCVRFSGALSHRPDQPFGFVITADNERVFVPPTIWNSIDFPALGEVSCKAIRANDARGREGWRALSLCSAADLPHKST